MICPKMTFYFKFIPVFLIILFLWQTQGLPAQEVNFAQQYEKAMAEYKKTQYDRARVRLERLAAVYRRIKNKTPRMNAEYIKILLTLGACHKRIAEANWAEMMKEVEKVEITGKKYIKGMGLSSKDSSILLQRKKESKFYKKVYKELKRIGVIEK